MRTGALACACLAFACATPAPTAAPAPAPATTPPAPTPATTAPAPEASGPSPAATAPAAVEPVKLPVDVDNAGVATLPALELACLSAADALTEPRNAWQRFDSVAGDQFVPVGELAFVLLERDPARSMTDPPPRLCRTIARRTVLRAPLMRMRESAQRWIVRRIGTGLVDDAAALVKESSARGLVVTAQPRVIVAVDGALLAVALPIGGGS